MSVQEVIEKYYITTNGKRFFCKEKAEQYQRKYDSGVEKEIRIIATLTIEQTKNYTLLPDEDEGDEEEYLKALKEKIETDPFDKHTQMLYWSCSKPKVKEITVDEFKFINGDDS